MADQTNSYVVISADGTVVEPVEWLGNEHSNVRKLYPGCMLVALADVKAPDADGKIRLPLGTKLAQLPDASKDRALDACCHPTRYERAMIRVECEVLERALAKAEGREPDLDLVEQQCSEFCARLFAERKARALATGSPEPPKGAEEADAQAQQLVREAIEREL